MDIYGIILVGNMIAATLGPWPETETSMKKCEEGAQQIEQNAADTIPDSGKMVAGERVYSEDVKAFCKRFEQRPEVGTEYTGDL